MALLSTITSEMHPNQQAQQARIRPRRRSRGERVSAKVMGAHSTTPARVAEVRFCAGAAVLVESAP